MRTRHAIARPDYVKSSAAKSSLTCLVGAVVLVFSAASFSQSLNDAVESQLEIRNAVPCAELRSGTPGPPGYLTGDLFDICTRGGGGAGTTPSTSVGGGAATPTVLPSIIQQRQREARGGKETPATTVSAASADAVVLGGKRRGFFISAEGEALSRVVSPFGAGYDSDIKRLTFGVDFQPTARWVAGLAFDGARQEGDFDGGGDFEVKSYGLVGFGSFLPTDRTYMQFYASYKRDSYARNRFALFSDLNNDGSLKIPPTAAGFPHADYNADQYAAGILGGYDFLIGNATISPFVGVEWKGIEFDAYSETGDSGLELTFYDDEDNSLQSSIGVQALLALRSGSWAVVPQASVNLKSEHKHEQRYITASFVGDTRAKRFSYQTDVPDSRWGEINVGVIVVSPSGLQVFGNYRKIVEHAYYDSDAVTVGMRIPF